jgi:hypothetical protein
VGRLIWVALFLASLADFWHYHKEDDVLFSLGLLFTMVAGYVANLKIEAPPKMVTSRVSFQGV